MAREAQSALVTWNSARPWLGTLIRLVLGVVWIWAALSKLAQPREFVQAVRAYDATPEWLSQGIGYGLPVLELSIGILLILGLVTRLAAIASGVLFLVFLLGIAQAAARGIQLDCGCFGGGGQTAGGTTYTLDILRDLGLFILAAYLVVWAMTRLSVDEFLARNDQVELPSAKRMRTDKGARKYNAMLEARRKEARSRGLWVGASMAVLVALIALIGVGVQSGRAKIDGSLTAKNASVANGVVFGKKAAATVDVYEDFQCPVCLQFEKSAAKTLDADVRANKAQVRFHMLAFLDSSSSGNRYSTRAANAGLCASDLSVDDFISYHNRLYGSYKGAQVQPAEGGNGRTNSQLISYAQAAGITGANLTTFTGCVQNEKHKALVEATTEHASQDGVTGTPTVKVNGKTIKNDLASFKSAIAAALKKGPAPDPSKTPTPSATPASTPATTPATSKPAGSSSSAKAGKSTPKAASSTPKG